MANRKGLGVSKKYANGTIHENASGRFMILDRFTEDENPEPILEFQWLTGEKEGKTETNKEINVNSSIHRYQVTRGIQGGQEPEKIDRDPSFIDKLDQTYDMVKTIKEHINVAAAEYATTNQTKLDTILTQLVTNGNFTAHVKETLDNAMILFDKRVTVMHELISKQESVIDGLLDKIKIMSERNEFFSLQQETLNRLVEKIK